MANVYIDVPVRGAIPYANIAAFPASAAQGAQGVAIDTDTFYFFYGTNWVSIGGPGSITSVGAFDTTPNAAGLLETSGAIAMTAADATRPGGVSAGTQTFGGVKTFASPTFTGTVSAAAITATGQVDNSAGPALFKKNVVANSSTAYTIDPANGSHFYLSLTANTVLTLAAALAAGKIQEMTVELIQSASNYTVSWAGPIAWVTGLAPSINPGSGSKTYVTLLGTPNGWLGFYIESGLRSIDGSRMAAGYLGEVNFGGTLAAAAVALTTGVAANVYSLPYTPGDYWATSTLALIPAGSTPVTAITASLNNVSATHAVSPNGGCYLTQSLPFTTGATQVFPLGGFLFNPTTSGTLYLVSTAVFTVSTCTAYGYINMQARR